MNILYIETATEVCSVAVSQDGAVVFEREETNGPSHATVLGVFADEALQFVRTSSLKLDAVAVSCGPGSYTGLRIGVSEAKGLCYGLGIPLIAIDTLKIMAKAALQKRLDDDVLLCPMIDARRMEVYDAIYDTHLSEVKAVSADIIDETSFATYLKDRKVAFFGNGADKCKKVLTDDNALFIDGVYPAANNMVELAEEAFVAGRFVDVAYFEPFYLKEFVATIAKNKVLPPR